MDAAVRRMTADQVIFYAFLADILFAPFLLPVPIPISVLLIPVWALFVRELNVPNRTIVACFIGILTAVISYIFGLTYHIFDSDILTQRVANTGILIFMFSAYFLGMNTRLDNDSRIVQFLRIYVIFNFAMAVLFIANPFMYFDLRTFWTFGDSASDISSVSSVTRFTGILSDPNNLAVSICAIAAVLALYHPEQFRRNLMTVTMTGIIVIGSMSTTGFICYGLLVSVYIFGSTLSGSTKLTAMFGAAVLALVAYAILKDTQIYTLAMDRVAASDADSRLSRWVIGLDGEKYIESLLVGDGGTVIWGGADYRPHNGHFHLIFSFGVLCYLAFVAVFFRIRRVADWRKHLFLVILFLGFTVNVGIYEHRFAGIWVVLLVLYHRIGVPAPPKAVAAPVGTIAPTPYGGIRAQTHKG